ncbi:hypothetical protein EXIGLDRAFT_767103 [Exidia glandulosa HHB12029]|uniref:Uncharacterized protein n=1 Tax=Exidia glandulosa HHB12029 TaxID=1314781 RepID=A0A165J808_EXIGL|nr:hypothetical protein EXIGLDRAFT_767103 [Exidia glandulosa HHB12029]
MPSYKLDVFITDAWADELKRLGLALCIAKNVNESYSVAWTAKQDYEFSNEFSWEDSYKLGTVQKFEVGKNLLKMVAAEKQPVTFGQTIIRDNRGNLGEATGRPSSADSFTFENRGDMTFPVIDQLINGEFQPAWADPYGMVTGDMTLIPRPKVLVFFDKGMRTGDMFTTVATPGVIEINFSHDTERAVSFVTSASRPGFGTWVNGQVVANFVERVPMSYSVANGLEPLSSGNTLMDDENGDE